MSREQRSKDDAGTVKGPQGESTKANLTYWSNRAERNSYTGGDNTGARDSGARAGAKADKNTSGSSYMRGVRRES